MARIASDVLASVERFLAAVWERIRIDAAYVYGSQVMGTARPWSDIDVAVVSSDFSSDLSVLRLAVVAFDNASGRWYDYRHEG